MSPWGQVASQTMLALGVTEDVVSLPVLRPLIGMDKVEIIRTAREIGTYETRSCPMRTAVRSLPPGTRLFALVWKMSGRRRPRWTWMPW